MKRVDSDSDVEESDHDSVESVDLDQDSEFDWKDLPAHSCSYCGIHDINSVVKCNAKNCAKWFCNCKGQQGGGASHIVVHLVKAKHNQISVHPESEFGQMSVECYICGNANVFVLGFVNIGEGDDTTVLFLCRTPCVQDKKYQDLEWDPASWNPLIQQKQLIHWLAQKPSDTMLKKMRDLDFEQIVKLEQLWKNNPNLKYEQLTKKKPERKLKSLLLRYQNGEQYRKIFQSLLNEEANSDKKIKESQTQNNITLRFQQTPKKRLNAYFVFASKEDYDTSLLPGNELKLSIKTAQHDWSSKGVVAKIMGNDQVCLQLFNHNHPPVESGYKVEFIWKSTSYLRMKKGLRRFQKQQKSITSYLYYRILGQNRTPPQLKVDVPKQVSAPGLPVLNYYQEQAVKKALSEPLCLIQGPPGTGKTITSASIVYQLVSMMRSKNKKGQVLVCAPSNVVVDMLAEKIYQTGLKVVRFCSKSRQSVSSSVEFLTLHNQVKNIKGLKYESLRGFSKVLEQQKQLSVDDQQKYNKQKKKAQIQVLTNADVICCTCITSADRRIREFTFHHVLIDQATQAIQPQCLLPMLKSAKQVILVGDHLQLGPVVICRQTAKAGLNRSLFERLVLLGHRPIRLQVQYRMHPNLTFFPSNTFYQGTLQNGITEQDRKINNKFPWPQNKPLFFLNVYGSQQISASGTSYLNRTQATAVQKIVFYLQKAGVTANQMGIITPYKGQRAYIINYLQKNGQLLSKNPNFYKQIEIASVDGYQGREKDYIIISCVRSNEVAGIGFLNDPRRLNVTITRAKYGMIVIGNARVLYRDNLWNNLLNHFKSLKTLVQGKIPHFITSQLSFPVPQKYIPERKNAYNDDSKDTQSEHNYDLSDNLNSFDFLNDAPITSGFRYSALGYNEIPEVAPFAKDRLFDVFSKKQTNTVDSFVLNGRLVTPSNSLGDLGLD